VYWQLGILEPFEFVSRYRKIKETGVEVTGHTIFRMDIDF
jgi:hypothetical protein